MGGGTNVGSHQIGDLFQIWDLFRASRSCMLTPTVVSSRFHLCSVPRCITDTLGARAPHTNSNMPSWDSLASSFLLFLFSSSHIASARIE